MRLLKYEEDGELNITTFEDNALPPYAILSHTWGPDEEEVTFQELKNGSGKAKTGYKKINFCGEQARCDGLEYFWVDTCCIDKTDQAELSWAIRSMFRWYQTAAKCYVYLADVSNKTRKADSLLTEVTWEPAFKSSRWFTRGWTLQELLAPGTVEFFSQEWEHLGNRTSLKLWIQQITGIPQKALEGTPISQFSVDDRLRWKGTRQTKYDEDAWYSLSGILDIEIAPAYGEGGECAFGRLMDERRRLERCIQDIYSTNPRIDKKRIEGTKGGLLVDSYGWVLDNTTFQQWRQNNDDRLLWVKGDPGKGKTMLLCGIIDWLQIPKSIPKTALLSYFFCQATDSRINSATAVLRGLLYMLITQQPSLVSHVFKRHDHAGRTLFEDANAWIALTEIFVDILRDPRLSTTYLIIDALDECVTDMPKLLRFIAEQSSASSCVKWVVSSRNWPDIEEQLERAGHKVRLSLELNAKSVAAAVGNYIRQKVDQLAQEKQYKTEMRQAVFKHLMSNANDTFLWVALVIQHLKTVSKRNVLKKLALFPPGLDALYERMMHQIKESEDVEICRQVLALTAVLYRPVTISELVSLVEQLEDFADDVESVREIISLCGSFLTLRKDTVYFVHQSAKDFLFKETSDTVFPEGTEDLHRMIFSNCLPILSRTLRRDMYGLQEPGYPIEDVKPPDPDPLEISRYPCIYWIDHLCDSKPKSSGKGVSDQQVISVVDRFLREKYLYWLEGLSLCKSMASGIISITKLWSLVQELRDADELTELVKDARRFIMYHKVAIESYPLQTYASALLFSPTGSLTRKLFQHEEPTDITIKPDMSNSWSPCLQTLEGLGKPVFTVALSQDSTQLASVSSNGIVKIWEPSSGACLETFDLLDTPAGQEKNCYRFEFSHDLKWVAFACKRDVGEDRVEVWDTDSRARVLTFKNFNARNTVDLYFDMAFSHHSTWLALASKSGTFRVWDTSNFTLLQRLDNYNCSYRSLAFSQDSVWLALWSYDGTIEILDTSSYMCLQTFQSSLRSVGLLAFSHDSTKLAYGGTYYNRTNIWDLSSGAVSQTFKHSDPVTALAFSRNSAWLAVGHGNGTITMYDTHSGVCLQILEGHREYVFSLAFCHDSSWLASSSIDETVKIWDTASIGACLRAPKRQSSDVMKVVFSYDLTRLASISTDGTVKIWDAASGTCLQQFAGHSKSVNDVAFSYDSRWLASAGHDCTVKIWDIASNGTCLYTLEGHSKYVAVVKFSKDSTRIASISNDETVKIWDTVSGVCLQTLGRCYRYYLHSLAFSYDNNLLASSAAHQQSRSTVKIWDVSSGKCLHILEDDLFSVSSITFSHDTTQLATVMPWFGQKNSKGITVKIWDVSSGTCPQSFQISIGSDWPPELLSFDQSKSCLYTDIGTIDLHSLENPTLRRFLSAGLTTHGPWIKHSGDNLLWVPSEYRGYRMSTRGSKMVIVDGLGKIWFYSTNR